MALRWIQEAAAEQKSMLLKAEELRKYQERRDDGRREPTLQEQSDKADEAAWKRGLRHVFGDWSLDTAGLLWGEMLTMPARYVLPASIAAAGQYWLSYERAAAQGAVLDVFASAGISSSVLQQPGQGGGVGAGAGVGAGVGGSGGNGTSTEESVHVELMPLLSRILAALSHWHEGWAVLRHLFLILLANWACEFIRSWAFAEAWAARKLASRVKLFANVLVQDAAWLDSQGSAALADRVQEEPSALDDLVVSTLERLARGTAALALLYHLIKVEPGLTALAILLRMPQIVQLVERGVQIAAAYERLQAHSLSLAQTRAVEAIGHARLLQVHTAERAEVAAYAAALHAHTRTVRASALAVALLRHAEGVLLVVTEILLLAYGGWRIIQGRLSLGTFTAYRALVGDFIDRFHGIEELYHSFRRAALLSKRYFTLRDRIPAVPLPPPAVAEIVTALQACATLPLQQEAEGPKGHAGHRHSKRGNKAQPLALMLEHVAFSYPSRGLIDSVGPPAATSTPTTKAGGKGKGNGKGMDVLLQGPPAQPHAVLPKPVLVDISVNIPAGACIAVVGPSGCGKSTLSRLLLRLYDPTSGRILLGGKDLRQWDTRALRRAVGTVDQEAALLNRSIASNIALGWDDWVDAVEDVIGLSSACPLSRVDPPREDIVAAAVKAHAHDFIMALPKGYDTIVGERGGRLSGGQRQRIAIARAILRDPSVLVLDEATAALDSTSEAAVSAALATLMKGRTTIMIAHRLSTVRRADVILVIDKGRIVESGTHESLLRDRPAGLYAQLVKHAQESHTADDSASVSDAASELVVDTPATITPGPSRRRQGSRSRR